MPFLLLVCEFNLYTSVLFFSWFFLCISIKNELHYKGCKMLVPWALCVGE